MSAAYGLRAARRQPRRDARDIALRRMGITAQGLRSGEALRLFVRLATCSARMQNSYLSLEHATHHPLLHGLEDTPRIINGVRRVATRCRTSQAYRSPLTLIATYPDLPMEEVFPRADSKTAHPEAYCMQHGRGRVVYFPFDLDRTFFEVMAVDHLTLLRNAVEWAADEEPALRVTGPGILDTTVFRQKKSFDHSSGESHQSDVRARADSGHLSRRPTQSAVPRA